MYNSSSLRSILGALLCGSLVVGLGACKKDEAKKAETPATDPAPADDKGEAPVAAPSMDAAAGAAGQMAEAKIAAASGSEVAGVAHFMMKGDKVMVHAKLTGLTPGDHGFHVHETGDCSAPDAKSAGGHFNPAGVDHGDPKGETHHSGDLGNIVANAEGVAEMSVELPTSFLSLTADAANSIVGRAVVVHGGADDLKSQPSGAAGPRVGCGVITLQ